MGDGRDSFETILARTRERVRRESLHRQIGALEGKLEKIGPSPIGLRRNRYFKLLSKLRRLKGQLAQPELFL